MLAGESPWGAGLDVVQTVAAVLQKDVSSPRGTPAALGRAVMRAMRKDPDARFGSMQEIVAALDAGHGRRRIWLAVPAIGLVLASAAVVFGRTSPEPAKAEPVATTSPRVDEPAPPASVVTEAPIVPAASAPAKTSAPRTAAPRPSARPPVVEEPPRLAVSASPPPATPSDDDLFRRH